MLQIEGLCGGYNGNVLRMVERSIAQEKQRGVGYKLILAGKKATGYFTFRGFISMLRLLDSLISLITQMLKR